MKRTNRVWTRAAFVFILASTGVCGASNCASGHAREKSTPTGGVGTRPASTGAKVADPIFVNGALGPGWNDWGWAPRDVKAGKSTRLDFSNYGGWILQRTGINPAHGGILVEYRSETKNDFLEIRFANEHGDEFPAIAIGPGDRLTKEDGTEQVYVAMARLNPDGAPFDRMTLRARRPLSKPWIEIDRIVFLTQSKEAAAAVVAAKKAIPTAPASVTIDCTKDLREISPFIYSIAYNARLDRQDAGFFWELKPPMRRWGGNPTSRYNHKHGRAWNTADDWFFQNLNFTGDPTYSYRTYFEKNEAKGVQTALTVPMLGWVAKDTKSVSFPVSKFGVQEQAAPENENAGNGKSKSGKPLKPRSPKTTSIPAPPKFVGDWVQDIGDAKRAAGDRLVDLYFLDNEPMLWNSTHRDLHPAAVTYSELLKRSIDYGTEIRKHDPKAMIAGPAVWGWPAYFYSARDSEVGFGLSPDRRRHGNTPLLEWYLQKLKSHREKTGVRILDVLDVHFYPQGERLYSEAGGGDVDDRRIRSVRGLWDPTYVDESWIADKIELIPRLKRLIAKTDPGIKLSIGEWSFGGERRMSGGIAMAEALGQFGRHGVDYAFYWTYPKKDSPAFEAFRAFRNYDGKGSRFLDWSVLAKADAGVSAFASTNEAKSKMVAVLINPTNETGLQTSVSVQGCQAISTTRAFQFAEGAKKMKPVDVDSKGGALVVDLPPWSVTVVEMRGVN